MSAAERVGGGERAADPRYLAAYLERFGTMTIPAPAPAARPCQCEHITHFTGAAHGYLEAPAGAAAAYFVGQVCDACATTHAADYLRRVAS